MGSEISPEIAAFHNILEQADNFTKCIELTEGVTGPQREEALKKALALARFYEEAILVGMISCDQKLQEQAAQKAISAADDPIRLQYWIIHAPTDELKILAKGRLKELKRHEA
ncbi:MAG: hypothetical protein PHC97_01535 [Patescibacteria group bacterium]|nr:hypothetical protein [Patescibacteria group bacterium]